jgi:hypothetical protein
MTTYTLASASLELARLATYGSTPWLDLDDGSRVRVRIEGDHDSKLSDYGDSFGRVQESRGRDRPEGFDGAARKIDSRQGPLWWQPPADVAKDAAVLASVEERVRGYYLEHWSFIGVVVKVESAPCPHCGERRAATDSLWGIESDYDEGYIAEVIGDCLSSAHAEARKPRGTA